MSTSYVEKIKKVENLNENGEGHMCRIYLRGLKKEIVDFIHQKYSNMRLEHSDIDFYFLVLYR